jgi:hypothetical protein
MLSNVLIQPNETPLLGSTSNIRAVVWLGGGAALNQLNLSLLNLDNPLDLMFP